MVFFCFIEQVSCFFEIMLYLCDNFKNKWGISSAGRAFDWQSKGGRFESCMLHFFFSTPLEFSLIKYKNRPCLTYSIYYYVQYFNHRRR